MSVINKQRKGQNTLIGALVGMGPRSTGLFYDHVMAKATEIYGAKNDMDFPKMMLSSVPTPFLPGEKLDLSAMERILVKAAQELALVNPNFIVMPCNIAHQYILAMQTAIPNIPILNMIKLTVNRVIDVISDIKNTKVGLIATQATVNTSLYQSQLTKKNLETFHSRTLQSKVTKLLTELKIHGLSDKAEILWTNVTNVLKTNDCTHAIIACTDISPCFSSFNNANLEFIDSLATLAHATISKYLSGIGNRQKIST